MTTTRNRDGSKSYGRHEAICSSCGDGFLARNRYGAEDKTRFCSRACYLNREERPHNHRPIGSRSVTRGYIVVKVCEGPQAWRYEHILIAERVLGRPLRRGECVHHVNGTKSDNGHGNLLICSVSYHRWLHERMAYLYQREHFTKTGVTEREALRAQLRVIRGKA